MIKASELRIGNWVNNHKEGYIKVSSIYIYGIRGWADLDFDNVLSFRHNSPDESDFAEEEIIGIPLTPEILEKAGFIKRFNEWKINEDDSQDYIHEFQNIFSYIVCDFGHDGCRDIEIKFLHQLQNLYFALTGEELEINL